MKIFPLSEGSFTVDRSKEFIPFNIEIDNLQARPAGSLLVEVQPFLVKMNNDLVLFDTGLGFKQSNGNLQLHNNILKLGFQPEDVTLVLMSHLHKDHAGGLQYTNADGIQIPAFSNARYCIYQKEMELALNGTSSSYYPSQYSIIPQLHNLHFLNGPGSAITTEISFEYTGAHSPEHIVFKLEENGQIIFFGGDVAPQLQQMKNRFIAKYDYNGRKSMELRKTWWQQGAAEKWTFMFYHDIKFPSYQFK